jgi:polar amino acid transport system substrate-binding protein
MHFNFFGAPIRSLRALAAVPIASIAVGALALGGCGTLSSSPAAGTFTPKTKGVLTVVTTDVPSAGFWTGTAASPTGGFEYELARDLATRFGLKSVRVELEHFHRVVAGRLDGADMALDLITPTDKRREHLDFSSPYLNGAPTVVTRSQIGVPDLATAQALQWGAVRATTLVDVIDNMISPDQPVRLYDNHAQLVAAVESGQVDATLLDMPQAVVTANDSGGRLAAVAQLAASEAISAALPKGSDNVQAVDSAMRAFTADGTIDRLLRKWIGAKAADAERSIPLLRTTL